MTVPESFPEMLALPLAATWITPSALLSVTCTLPWLVPLPSLRVASTSASVNPALLRSTTVASVAEKEVLAMVKVGGSLTAATVALIASALVLLLYCVEPPDFVLLSETSTNVPLVTAAELSIRRADRLPGVPL